MKKWSWSKFIEALLFIGIAIVFMSVNFYQINETVQFEWSSIPTHIYQIGYWEDYFGSFFEHTWQNVWLSLFFFGIGIVKLIGVRKNGN